MIANPLTHWTHFWFEKARAYLPTNLMTNIQSAIFWNAVQRIFYNPILLAHEISISQLNSFVASVVEKLTFDSLTEMTNNEALSNEARRFQIIKSILQEYSDVIIGPNQWLSKTVLGAEFYNHLTDPKKVKDVNNRQKQFKQYKVSCFLLLSVYPNLRKPVPLIFLLSCATSEHITTNSRISYAKPSSITKTSITWAQSRTITATSTKSFRASFLLSTTLLVLRNPALSGNSTAFRFQMTFSTLTPAIMLSAISSKDTSITS